MFGLFAGLLLRAGVGVADYIENQKSLSRPPHYLYNGLPLNYDRRGCEYVCGEKTYNGYFVDANGHEHHTMVGVNTGRVYYDSFEKEKLANEKRDEENRKKMVAEGKKAYLKHHPNTPLINAVTTEMSTGRIIAKLVAYQDGRCFKEYGKADNKYYTTSDGIKVPITAEEFDALNIHGGTHFVFGKPVRKQPVEKEEGESFIDYLHRQAAYNIEQSLKKGEYLPQLDNSKVLKKYNIDPNKYYGNKKSV